mmetsp:Transcript_33128/g.98555  ORF Transcript_33128/g.98555 Transcript_33128/m.98555 type:complete len:291 (-) Transcript_33128:1077-1949(-)
MQRLRPLHAGLARPAQYASRCRCGHTCSAQSAPRVVCHTPCVPCSISGALSWRVAARRGMPKCIRLTHRHVSTATSDMPLRTRRMCRHTRVVATLARATHSRAPHTCATLSGTLHTHVTRRPGRLPSQSTTAGRTPRPERRCCRGAQTSAPVQPTVRCWWKLPLAAARHWRSSAPSSASAAGCQGWEGMAPEATRRAPAPDPKPQRCQTGRCCRAPAATTAARASSSAHQQRRRIHALPTAAAMTPNALRHHAHGRLAVRQARQRSLPRSWHSAGPWTVAGQRWAASRRR